MSLVNAGHTFFISLVDDVGGLNDTGNSVMAESSVCFQINDLIPNNKKPQNIVFYLGSYKVIRSIIFYVNNFNVFGVCIISLPGEVMWTRFSPECSKLFIFLSD